jgi:hypothetical protein
MEITADMVAKRIAAQVLTTINGVANGEVIITNTENLTPDQWARIESIRQNSDGTATAELRDNTDLLSDLARLINK